MNKRKLTPLICLLMTGALCLPAKVSAQNLFRFFTDIVISNSAGLSAVTLLSTSNAQHIELEKAYIALLNDSFKDLYAIGFTLDQASISTVDLVTSGCPSGLTCHSITAYCDISTTSGGTPNSIVISSVKQVSVDAGALICYHQQMYPMSIIKILTGKNCTRTPAPTPLISTSAPTRKPTQKSSPTQTILKETIYKNTIHR